LAAISLNANAVPIHSNDCGRNPLNDNVAGPPKTTQLEALHGLARALASGEFRARAVLERACAAVAGGFGFQRVGIVRFLPDTSTLVPFAGHGLTMDEIRSLPPALPVGHFGAFARALATRRAVYVEDPSTEAAVPERIARDFGLKSFVIVPLTTDGRCFGFMTCDQRAQRFLLDEAEVDLLTTFGTLIAGFLEKAIEHGQLRRLNELKSQFVALASHELRTPAGSVYGAVRTLDEREHELTDEQRGELRRMLTEQSARLVDLVDSLLDLSRLEADAIRMAPIEIDVRARVVELARAVFDRSSDLTIDVPDDLRATVDPQAFDRVVSNLLVNARRHGGPPVVVTARRDGTDLDVVVEDRGAGVPSDFADRLFDRFHAARHGPRRRSRPGPRHRAILCARSRRQPHVRASEPAWRSLPAGPASRLIAHQFR
jgi:signal transduction histidine kinase